MALGVIGDKFGVASYNHLKRGGYGDASAPGTNEWRVKVSAGATVSRDLAYWTGAAWAPINAVPPGMIALFDTACPDGWTRFVALDNAFPRGAATYGGTGGAATHSHTMDTHHHHVTVDIECSGNSGHDHTATTSGPDTTVAAGSTGTTVAWFNHVHTLTTNVENSHHHHAYAASIDSDSVVATMQSASSLPPYVDMVYCKKNALA